MAKMNQIAHEDNIWGNGKGRHQSHGEPSISSISLLQRVLRDFLPNPTNSSHFLFFCHLPLFSRLSFCLSIYKLMVILLRMRLHGDGNLLDATILQSFVCGEEQQAVRALHRKRERAREIEVDKGRTVMSLCIELKSSS